MKVAIVDDMEQDRLWLKNLVVNWGEEQQEEIQLSLFDCGEAFLQCPEFERFSIVLLDLFMTGMDGMETAREIRRRGRTCQIVFITSSDTYALQGYEVDAANYLLKPVELAALKQALDHCLARLGSRGASITVVSNRANIKIPLERIIWIEAQRNALLFHTDGGPIKSYMTIESVMNMLAGYRQFLHCCKGILVNMDRITSVGEDDFIMDDSELVPIRKRGGNQVKRDYLSYLFSRGRK